MLKEKLKGFEEKFKVWSWEVFGFLDFEVDNNVMRLNKFDPLVSSSSSSFNTHLTEYGMKAYSKV